MKNAIMAAVSDVEEGKPLYVKLTSGEHAGKVYHTDALSKLKTA